MINSVSESVCVYVSVHIYVSECIYVCVCASVCVCVCVWAFCGFVDGAGEEGQKLMN